MTSLNKPPSELLKKSYADPYLRPFFGLIHEAVIGGYSDYEHHYDEQARVHRANTVRSLRRDHIVNRLRNSLPSQFFSVVETAGTTYFDTPSGYRIVVRKLDRSHHISQNRTGLAKEIQANKQAQNGENCAYIYLGYIDPILPGGTPEVYFVCPKGIDVGEAWSILVLPPADENRGDKVVRGPDQPSSSLDARNWVRLKHKKDTTQKNG
ncbi:hypothetical protein [Granulibacter bethesdensis]|uniref:hypothetical protein n=1 Tax=Granulibacter bethesdensis TaxID=364410 RepID=UPI000F7B512A|nr:hypothetical protein [Granulibacter bethesdensis]